MTTSASRASLEEERDFLLRSLDDLEREFAAGDVDATDYATLRDDYTARAAAVLRDIEAERTARETTAAPRSWGRTIGWVLGIVVFAVLAGLLVARMSGSRRDNDTASGDVRENSRALLADASTALQQGNFDDAIDLYTQTLELSVTNVEAQTYRGWAHSLNGDDDAALADLDAAVELDPDYPDARVFRASVLTSAGRFADAAGDLAVFDELDPPAIMRNLVTGRSLRERIIAGVLLADDPPSPADAGFDPADVRSAAVYLAETVGSPRDSIALLDQVLATDAADVEAHAYKGWVLARVGVDAEDQAVIDAGLAEIDAALALDPQRADALVYRAFTAMYGKDDAAAAQAALAAFDALADRPAELIALIDSEGLRDAITARSGE